MPLEVEVLGNEAVDVRVLLNLQVQCFLFQYIREDLKTGVLNSSGRIKDNNITTFICALNLTIKTIQRCIAGLKQFRLKKNTNVFVK